MDVLIPIFGVMIPLVAIIGGLSYRAFDKWHDTEQERWSMQAANGSEELSRRVHALEDDLALLRNELADRSQDMDERLQRIEILLREVE